ncbi:hypothetical protein Xen7305DRAFT_00039190 [Xenococcus sp. PCC 7305]|uniref:hypothetical protein n=1 Tax=Xenococcus sp. PCC 7305 TaxID=102125 RepID=UPI0002ABA5A7|nr:hypothetical protein [Xenococcus sp. PCC 7305]ELS04191.1 hypothetical protein Xen7305DRAFT_00039190 [Xenococcus sp. PCC 7305]
MNRQLLTVLGCSSSLALTLLSTNPAEANSSSEYVFTAPIADTNFPEIPASSEDYPFFDCSCSEYDPAMKALQDREGEKAISLYGCDCAGCRRLARNLGDELSSN